MGGAGPTTAISFVFSLKRQHTIWEVDWGGGGEDSEMPPPRKEAAAKTQKWLAGIMLVKRS